MADHQKGKTIPIEVIEGLCQCALCLNTYEDPKTLPCRHSFCSDCLDNLVQFIDNKKIMIKCPTCQRCNNLSAKMTVSKLKTELALIQMLHMLKTSGNDDMSTFNSISCEVDDCVNMATYWNKDCQRFECGKCDPLFYSRQKIDYSKNDDSMEFFCELHGSFQRMYCEKCKKPLCTYCKEWNHNCQIYVLKQMVDCQTTRKIRLEQSTEKIKDTIKTLELRQEETSSFVSASISEIEEKVQILAEDIKKILNEAVDTCKDEYLKNFRSSMKYFSVESTNALNVFQELHQSGERLLQSGQNIELFCKTPVIGLKMANFEDFHLLNPNAFKVSLESNMDNDSKRTHFEVIEKSIRHCFGKITIERNPFCGHSITPDMVSSLASDDSKLCGETLFTTASISVDAQSLSQEEIVITTFNTNFQGFKWKLQVQLETSEDKEPEAVIESYVTCEPIDISVGFPYKPSIQFRLSNTNGEDISIDMFEIFTVESSTWGDDLITLKDLNSEENGYLVDGKFTVNVVVRAQVNENTD